MKPLGEYFQTADWKQEKHVPVIDSPDEVKADEYFQVHAEIGKEVPHPNTTEHHIAWIALYFQAEGDKFTKEVGFFHFSSHGESVKGPNEGPVHTHHAVTSWMKTTQPGTLYALAYCNIHGLWEYRKEIKVS
jgi:superoxide reductase